MLKIFGMKLTQREAAFIWKEVLEAVPLDGWWVTLKTLICRLLPTSKKARKRSHPPSISCHYSPPCVGLSKPGPTKGWFSAPSDDSDDEKSPENRLLQTLLP